jgi:hypothetical protein
VAKTKEAKIGRRFADCSKVGHGSKRAVLSMMMITYYHHKVLGFVAIIFVCIGNDTKNKICVKFRNILMVRLVVHRVATTSCT